MTLHEESYSALLERVERIHPAVREARKAKKK